MRNWFVFILFLVIMAFACRKKIDYNIYFSYGGFLEYPKGISSGEGLVVVAFPSIYGRCAVKLYPQSSISFDSAFIYLGKPHILIENFVGLIFLYSDNCIFEFDDKRMLVEDSKVILRGDKEKLRIEVLEGEVKVGEIKIKRGQGFLPGEGYIYAMKKSVKLIFPKDGQKLYIPVFFWERGDEAVNYILEIALDKDFLKSIFYTKVKENKFFPEVLTLQKYSHHFFWRVWYEDKSGIFSLPSQPEIADIPTTD